MHLQGTWQFMSVALLLKDTKVVEIPDELESFFHVLVYYSVRFVDSNIDYADNFICDYFDARLQYLDGERCGSLK